MIISASRRTDIPAYFSQWFINRMREGYVLVRNPMNPRQVNRVSLTPDVVDGIVFWTKNPLPLLDKLNSLKDYAFYFQFTITPYGTDIEPNIPSKEEVVIPAFQRLADLIGPHRVIWRYDPIMLSPKYSIDYHIQAFEKIAGRLKDHTKKCTISFIDMYRNTLKNVQRMNLLDFPQEKMLELSKSLADIAGTYGLRLDACAEKTDLRQFGIDPARCIDNQLLDGILECSLHTGKDKNQRPECGCASSIDIGMYNTCRNLCGYCYANYNEQAVIKNVGKHDPASPLLIGAIGAGDIITERKVSSCRDGQISLLKDLVQY